MMLSIRILVGIFASPKMMPQNAVCITIHIILSVVKNLLESQRRKNDMQH
jgi:hypothetical protein